MRELYGCWTTMPEHEVRAVLDRAEGLTPPGMWWGEVLHVTTVRDAPYAAEAAAVMMPDALAVSMGLGEVDPERRERGRATLERIRTALPELGLSEPMVLMRAGAEAAAERG